MDKENFLQRAYMHHHRRHDMQYSEHEAETFAEKACLLAEVEPWFGGGKVLIVHVNGMVQEWRRNGVAKMLPVTNEDLPKYAKRQVKRRLWRSYRLIN